MLLGHEPYKTFLVPDSCRATERNGNSISTDVTDDTIENDLNDALFQIFSDNLEVVLDFLTLQDKPNIRTLSLNIKFIYTRCETGLNSEPSILPVSKARTNKFYIYRQCTYIVYLFPRSTRSRDTWSFVFLTCEVF